MCVCVCVNKLFVLSVKVPGNSRILVVKSGGGQKLHLRFWLYGGIGSLTQRGSGSASLFLILIYLDLYLN